MPDDSTATATAPAASEAAATVLERADALAACTEEPGRLTRRFATPALRGPATSSLGWMREAGMAAGRDAIGNVVGRWAPPGRPPAPRPCCSARTSTRCATPGRYDGMLGVLVALAVVEGRGATAAAVRDRGARLRRRGGRALRHRLPRQPASSRARSTPPTLDRARRRRHRDARRDRRVRRRPGAIAGAARATATTCSATSRSTSSRGRCSRRADLPVGVVTAITGQTPRRGRPSRAWPATPGPCRWRRAATRSPPPPSGSLAVEAAARGGRRPRRDGRRVDASSRARATSSPAASR